MSPSESGKDLLCETGQVYVTLAAAQEYAHLQRLQVEQARRTLTEYLLEATRSGDVWDQAEGWRYRRKSSGVDITARVVREGRLAVVVAINARRY